MQAASQARESQAKRQSQQNPFFSAFAQAQQQQQRQRQRQQQQRGAGSGPGFGAGRAGFGGKSASNEGPVIDVEYSTVDED